MTSDAIFRTVTIAALAAAVGGTLVHFLAAGRKIRSAGPAGGPERLTRLGPLERLAFWGLALTLLALAVTGLVPNLLLGETMEDWLLMAHVAAGGAFIACLLLLAVLWAEDCRFQPYDAEWCSAACRGRQGPAGRFDAAQKTTFWAALLLGVVSTLTMMVSMLPIFTPDGLDVLREIHRYCGLLFVVIAYVHFYQTIIVRRGRLGWLLSGRVSADWAEHYHRLWWQTVKDKE